MPELMQGRAAGGLGARTIAWPDCLSGSPRPRGNLHNNPDHLPINHARSDQQSTGGGPTFVARDKRHPPEGATLSVQKPITALYVKPRNAATCGEAADCSHPTAGRYRD